MKFIAFLFLFSLVNCYKWEEKYYDQMPIDHFSYSDTRTFRLRYFINRENWDAQHSGPIFVYCGNELALESFAENTGFMWDIAPEFKAMVLFIEHRFYGKSLPFGEQSFSNLENLGKLSTEQALGDFAQLIEWLKANVSGAAHSPVVAFGGSYGAILAAWFRIKYPHIVVGALASSGPMLQFPGMNPCWTFAAATTRTFDLSGQYCTRTVRNGWPAIRRLAKTESGRSFLSREFQLCDPLETESDADLVVSLANTAFGYLAMMDYPYGTDFVAPVPAWPVKVACEHLNDPSGTDEQLATAMYKAMNIWFNYTGQLECNLNGDMGAIGMDGWNFQTCTELAMPLCQNGTDMFEVQSWEPKPYSDNCAETYWGVRPRFNWVNTEYGGKRLTWATNLIISNGELDPWSGGSVTEPYPGMDPSVHIIYIKEAGHHLDLRSEHPADGIYVRRARREEIQIIKRWVKFRD